ncbi:MAG TPA: hypothetical protein VIU41_03915 [Geobacteraceae bacterium]
MAQDIVSTIVAVEEEIQLELAEAQQQAADCLAELRRASVEALTKEEARLQEELAAAVAAVREGGAPDPVEALLAEAREWADRLAGLDDERLQGCILRELPWIVGRADNAPD